MKINQAENTFAPITIVLESEAEAKLLATLVGAMTNRVEEAITGECGGRVAQTLFDGLKPYHVPGRVTVSRRD